MAQLDTINLDAIGQKVLVYGASKTGKTLLAGQLGAKFKNVIWFDLERGILTLKQLPIAVQANINIIRIPDNRKDYPGITAMLKISEGPVEICDMHGTIGLCLKCRNAQAMNKPSGTMQNIDIELAPTKDTVFVLDSMTQLTHSAMGFTFKGKQMKDIQSMPEKQTFHHYMIQGFFLDRFLTNMQNSSANWVVISHEESLELTDGTEKLVPMAGTRNFSKNSARYYDHCVHCSIINNTYRRNSSGTTDGKVLSGSRTDIDLAKNPELGIVDLLRSKNTPKVVPAASPNLGELVPVIPGTLGLTK